MTGVLSIAGRVEWWHVLKPFLTANELGVCVCCLGEIFVVVVCRERI